MSTTAGNARPAAQCGTKNPSAGRYGARAGSSGERLGHRLGRQDWLCAQTHPRRPTVMFPRQGHDSRARSWHRGYRDRSRRCLASRCVIGLLTHAERASPPRCGRGGRRRVPGRLPAEEIVRTCGRCGLRGSGLRARSKPSGRLGDGGRSGLAVGSAAIALGVIVVVPDSATCGWHTPVLGVWGRLGGERSCFSRLHDPASRRFTPSHSGPIGGKPTLAG